MIGPRRPHPGLRNRSFFTAIKAYQLWPRRGVQSTSGALQRFTRKGFADFQVFTIQRLSFKGLTRSPSQDLGVMYAVPYHRENPLSNQTPKEPSSVLQTTYIPTIALSNPPVSIKITSSALFLGVPRLLPPPTPHPIHQ